MSTATEMPHPVPGCKGFVPASNGQTSCSCWRFECSPDGEFLLTWRGPVENFSDEMFADATAIVDARLRDVLS